MSGSTCLLFRGAPICVCSFFSVSTLFLMSVSVPVTYCCLVTTSKPRVLKQHLLVHKSAVRPAHCFSTCHQLGWLEAGKWKHQKACSFTGFSAAAGFWLGRSLGQSQLDTCVRITMWLGLLPSSQHGGWVPRVSFPGERVRWHPDIAVTQQSPSPIHQNPGSTEASTYFMDKCQRIWRRASKAQHPSPCLTK